jgi:hypothetical protein
MITIAGAHTGALAAAARLHARHRQPTRGLRHVEADARPRTQVATGGDAVLEEHEEVGPDRPPARFQPRTHPVEVGTETVLDERDARPGLGVLHRDDDLGPFARERGLADAQHLFLDDLDLVGRTFDGRDPPLAGVGRRAGRGEALPCLAARDADHEGHLEPVVAVSLVHQRAVLSG